MMRRVRERRQGAGPGRDNQTALLLSETVNLPSSSGQVPLLPKIHHFRQLGPAWGRDGRGGKVDPPPLKTAQAPAHG